MEQSAASARKFQAESKDDSSSDSEPEALYARGEFQPGLYHQVCKIFEAHGHSEKKIELIDTTVGLVYG